MSTGKPSDRLKKEMKARGWTMDELARRADVSVRSVYRILCEGDQRVGTWQKLADGLGVPLSWLLCGIGCQAEQVTKSTVFVVRYDPLAMGDGRLAEFVGELQRRYPRNVVIYEAMEVRCISRRSMRRSTA